MGNTSLTQKLQLEGLSLLPPKIICPWIKTLTSLGKNIHKNYSYMDILGDQVWEHIITKFSSSYLLKHEQLEFFFLIRKVVEFNRIQQLKKQQFQICGEAGEKFMKLQNRVEARFRHCLDQLSFLKKDNKNSDQLYDKLFTQLKFDLSEQEVSYLMSIVRPFSEHNIDAIALLGLYLQVSTQRLAETQRFSEIQLRIKSIIESLETQYPSLQPQMKEIENSYGLYSMKDPQSHEMIYFESNGKSHYDQLLAYVYEKIEKAKQSQKDFIELIEDICLMKGQDFRITIKVSDKSVSRIVAKMFEKPEYQEAFQRTKNVCLESADKIIKQKSHGMTSYVKWEKQQVKNTMRTVAEKQNKIEFPSKDLLRGKCFFNNPQDIIETVNFLQYKINRHGYRIISLQNQMCKKEKNVFMLIKLPYAIASLQLCLKKDWLKNEFYKKLTKLKKTSIHTIVTNLFSVNKRLCESYFIQNFQLFHEMLKIGQHHSHISHKKNTKLNELHEQIQQFKQQYLLSNHIKVEKVEAQSIQEQNLINLKIQQLNERILGKSQDLRHRQNILQRQKINKVSFYYKNQELKNLEQALNKIDHEQIQQNVTLLKIKGDLMFQTKKYDQAIKCYSRCAKFFENRNLQKVRCYQNHTLLQNHDRSMLALADMNMRIAKVHKIKGQHLKAMHFFVEAEKIQSTIHGTNNSKCIPSLKNLAQAYMTLKLYPKAVEKYQKIVQLFEISEPQNQSQYSDALINLGMAELQIQNWDSAHKNLFKALQVIKTNKGNNSLDCAKCYSHLASYHMHRKEFQKAEQMGNRSLQIVQKIKGKNSIKYAKSLSNLIEIQFKKNDFVEAENLFRKCFETIRKIQGQESSHMAKLYVRMGYLYKNAQKYEQALKYFQKSKQAYESQGLNNTEQCATLYSAMGTSFYHLGLNFNSLEFYQKSQQAYLSLNKQLSPQYANLLWEMTTVLIKQKNYDRIIETLEKALDIRHKLNGKHDLQDCAMHVIRAKAYKNKGKNLRALESLLASLKIKEQLVGAEDFGVTVQHHMLGGLYYKMGENFKAMEHYEKQILICNKSKQNSLDRAYAYHSASYVYQSQHQLQKAFQYQQQALKTFQHQLPSNNKIIALTKQHISHLQQKSKTHPSQWTSTQYEKQSSTFSQNSQQQEQIEDEKIQQQLEELSSKYNDGHCMIMNGRRHHRKDEQ